MFDKIKSYYENGTWSIAMARNAILKGKISEEEFFDITGEEY